MDNTITLIVKATVNPAETESFNAYIQGLLTLYQQHHVVQTGYYPVKAVFIGEEKPGFISIYSFSGQSAMDNVYQSEEYIQHLLPLRKKAFLSLEVFIS